MLEILGGASTQFQTKLKIRKGNKTISQTTQFQTEIKNIKLQ